MHPCLQYWFIAVLPLKRHAAYLFEAARRFCVIIVFVGTARRFCNCMHGSNVGRQAEFVCLMYLSRLVAAFASRRHVHALGEAWRP